MADGHTHITAQAPSAASVKRVHDLQNWRGWKLPRQLTDDEVTFFAEALDAGAVLVPRLLREYLSGENGCPFQFENCSASIWPEDQGAQPYVAPARAKRDAFLARWRDGDLAVLVARINAAAQRVSA